jgi:hypothetical protein
MRQPSIVRFLRPAGCATARIKTASSMAAKSSCQETTPDPRAATAKAATVSAGPLIVR